MAQDEWTTILEPRPLANFVDTGYTREITERAMGYVAAGFPVHFRGAAGTGKTTLAMHLAGKIGRPVILIHGDEEHSTSDLVGSCDGYRMKRVVDNFIHSVLKTEQSIQRVWMDDRLTVACKHGYTLIYDEFTRSRPEANNVLLSILQEKLVDLPPSRGGYLRVDPNFVAIFTSNPEEYAGVYRSQDALRDRMVTIDLDHPDRETEVAITAAKSGLDALSSRKIVEIVRGLRDSGGCEFSPTVRGCIMVARTLKTRNGVVDAENKLFRTICMDVLASEATRVGTGASARKVKGLIGELIDRHCRNGAQTRRR
jgi:gas vesicle protein GvpN